MSEIIYSKPTLCIIGCHLVSILEHEGKDTTTGEWVCPNCKSKYKSAHWKIKKQVKGKSTTQGT